MDLDMFTHHATQTNLQTLMDRGIHVIEPGTGPLASGLHGKGRMAEPEDIADQVAVHFASHMPWAGQKVLITAGPTYEPLDAVRFLGNRSSGKMGFALAEVLANAGAEVTIVAGPVHMTTPDRVHARRPEDTARPARRTARAADAGATIAAPRGMCRPPTRQASSGSRDLEASSEVEKMGLLKSHPDLQRAGAKEAGSGGISSTGLKVLMLLAVQNCVKNLVTRVAVQGDAHFLYSAAVLATESTKCTASLLYIFLVERGTPAGVIRYLRAEWKKFLLLMVPAAVYNFQQMLEYVALKNLDPALFASPWPRSSSTPTRCSRATRRPSPSY